MAVYILSGAFTLELAGQARKIIKAGEGFVEPPNVKMAGFNRSTREALHLVIFHVGDPGTPFLDPIHQRIEADRRIEMRSMSKE